MKRKLWISLPVLLLLAALLSFLPKKTAPIPDGDLQVHFIDVGQADCILLTAGGSSMLIDAGNTEDADVILGYLRSQGITGLTYAVGTHPHEDHIGSLGSVLRAFPAEHLLMPRIQHNTDAFEAVLDAALAQGLSVTAPRAGDTFPLGDATVTAVSNYSGSDLNESSIMLRVTFGATSFLFTADAEAEAEEAALSTGLPLKSDVLKVGHHGSNTSSTPDFLAAVSPDFAVISCGAGNDYGHPHKGTLDRLQEHGATVYRTDLQGTVVAVSDGESILWEFPDRVGDTPQIVPVTYVLNTSSMKYHRTDCQYAANISEKNRQETSLTADLLQAQGYTACGSCKP